VLSIGLATGFHIEWVDLMELNKRLSVVAHARSGIAVDNLKNEVKQVENAAFLGVYLPRASSEAINVLRIHDTYTTQSNSSRNSTKTVQNNLFQLDCTSAQHLTHYTTLLVNEKMSDNHNEHD